jgi:hypothetical protein
MSNVFFVCYITAFNPNQVFLGYIFEHYNIHVDFTFGKIKNTSAPGGLAAPKIMPRDFLYSSGSVNVKEVCFV